MRHNQPRFQKATPTARLERVGGPPNRSSTWMRECGLGAVGWNDSRRRRPPVDRDLMRQIAAVSDPCRHITGEIERRLREERAVAPHHARLRMPDGNPGKQRDEASPDRARKHS